MYQSHEDRAAGLFSDTGATKGGVVSTVQAKRPNPTLNVLENVTKIPTGDGDGRKREGDPDFGRN